MSSSRMAVFLGVVLSIWTALHLFVFRVLGSVPWVAAHMSRRTLVMLAIGLWSAYPLARMLDARKWDRAALPLEWVGSYWIGILFLLFAVFLVTEIVTFGGLLVPQLAPRLFGWAALAAVALSLIAIFQGARQPVISDYQIHLRTLPPASDGLSIVAISDLHLGTLLGRRWLARQVERIREAKPDIIAIVGDLVDGNVARVQPLLPVLQELRAPLGVWAVSGNHEYYAGLDRCLEAFAAAGYSVLRDRWVEVAPGLMFAGVDDLTARSQFGIEDKAMEKALANRPPGATVLLSHSPLRAEQAAAAGVDLMLSGHTHAGQVWPFNFLVRARYALVEGLYKIDGMTAIVGRGVGTWGPRMRLWRPAEILRITLRSAPA